MPSFEDIETKLKKKKIVSRSFVIIQEPKTQSESRDKRSPDAPLM